MYVCEAGYTFHNIFNLKRYWCDDRLYQDDTAYNLTDFFGTYASVQLTRTIRHSYFCEKHRL